MFAPANSDSRPGERTQFGLFFREVLSHNLIVDLARETEVAFSATVPSGETIASLLDRLRGAEGHAEKLLSTLEEKLRGPLTGESRRRYEKRRATLQNTHEHARQLIQALADIRTGG